MGGGKGSSQQTSTFQPPPFALAGGEQAIDTARVLAQTPFNIPVQPIAGLQPQQTQAFNQVQEIQGMAQPYFDTATQLEQQSTNPQIAQYFGAESAGVIPQLQNIFGQQMAQTTGDATQVAGGIGADRIAVAQSELGNQQGLAAGQVLSQLMGQSVNQSLQGAGITQQAGRDIAQMGPAAQTAALQGTQAELQSGTLQQQQLQNQLNANYENVLQQISWPFQTNQYLGSMAAGVTPAMGGTGVTSGNTKSASIGSGGLGKGLGAMGMMKGSGGSIPWQERGEDGEATVEGFQAGGTVNPFGPMRIDPRTAKPAMMRSVGGAAGGNRAALPMQEGGFTPIAGQSISVPFGPDLGGPFVFTADNAPVPQIHAPDMKLPTEPSGGISAQFMSDHPMPAFDNPFLANVAKSAGVGGGDMGGDGGPLSSFLQGLVSERSSLIGRLNNGPSGGSSGTSAPGGTGGSGGSGRAQGGGTGDMKNVPTASLLFGATGGTPDVGAGSEQKDVAGNSQSVGNLLGSNKSGVPILPGEKDIIPQTAVQPGQQPAWMQQMMQQFSHLNDKKGDQGGGGGGGGGGGQKRPQQSATPFQSVGDVNAPATSSPTPTLGTGAPMNTGAPLPMGGAGDSWLSGAQVAPVDAGADPFGAIDMPFARGGRLHYDDGGDTPFDGGDVGAFQDAIASSPINIGMNSGSTPFSPQAEIGSQVLPYNIESNIYNQPNQQPDKPMQMAGMTLDPEISGKLPTPAGSPMAPNPQDQGPLYPKTPFNAAGVQGPPGSPSGPYQPNPDYSTPFTGYPGYGMARGLHAPLRPDMAQQQEPTPQLAIPPTQGEARVQDAIQNTQKAIDGVKTLGKEPGGLLPTPVRTNLAPPPATPFTPPQPPAAPQATSQAPQAPSTPPAAAAKPVEPANITNARRMLDQPIGNLAQQFAPGTPTWMIPDNQLSVRDWMQKHPELAGQMTQNPQFLQRAGLTANDLQKALQPPPTAPAQEAEAPRPPANVPQRSADAQAVIDSANRLKMDPRMLARILNFESGFKLNAVGPSGHGYPVKGLIGFDPDNIAKYGEPGKTFAEQMPQIEKYMLDRGWKPGVFDPNDIARAYSIVNAGSLDKNGNPRLGAADINGTIEHHIQNIESARNAAAADKFLGMPPGTPARTATQTQAQPNAPATQARAPADYPSQPERKFGPPPGSEGKFSKMGQFLTTFGTGDPTAYFRGKMAELGYYKELANWDEARTSQYGGPNATPQGDARTLMNEAGATRKAIGVLAGADHEAGAPPDVSRPQGPGGGGQLGGPGGGGGQGPAPGAPQIQAPQPGTPQAQGWFGTQNGQQMTPEQQNLMRASLQNDEMERRAQAQAARGNPAAMERANATIAAAQNRRMQLEEQAARTGLLKMQTANVGWQKQGNIFANPAQGKAFVPGMGVVPYGQAFGQSGSPFAPPAASQYAPSGAGAQPLEQAPPPKPLPSGAGPETAAAAQQPQQPPAGGQQPAAPVNPQFAPTGGGGEVPVNKTSAFQVTPIRPTSWPVDRTATDAKAEKELLEDQEASKNAGQVNAVLDNLDRNYATALKKPTLFTTPGWASEQRAEVATALNTVLAPFGISAFDPDSVGSIQALEKNRTQLATASVKGLGREPGYILNMLRTSMVPGHQMTPEGYRDVVSTIRALNHRLQDYATEKEKYVGTFGTSNGFQTLFEHANPVEKYGIEAEVGAARYRNGADPMTSRHVDNLKNYVTANPDKAPAAYQAYANAWKIRPSSAQFLATH